MSQSTEIKQIDLNAETAARSYKLFYYLTQSLAKWKRGIELLRPAQRDKDRVPAVRDDSNDHFLAASSRMPAVFVREQALKLHQVSHLKRPTDLIPILRIQFSKAEAKLSKGKDDKEGKGKKNKKKKKGPSGKRRSLPKPRERQ